MQTQNRSFVARIGWLVASGLLLATLTLPVFQMSARADGGDPFSTPTAATQGDHSDGGGG